MVDTSYLEGVLAIKAVYIMHQGHSNVSSSVIWTHEILLGLVVSFVILRLCVRLFLHPGNGKTGAIGSDDYLIAGATLATISLSILAITGAWHGLGRHIYDIVPEDPKLENAQRLVLLLYGCYISYAVANALTKFSIIASYLRIFPGIWFRRVILAIGICTVLQALVSVILIFCECQPAASSWNWNLKRKKCIDIAAFFYATSAINTAIDFVLLAAPMPYLFKSNMAPRRKCGLILLFSVGFIGCLSGFFRMGKLKGLASIDITYTGVLPLNCSMGEVSFGIICACIPPLRPAFRIIMQRLRLLFGAPPVTMGTSVLTPQISYSGTFRTISTTSETAAESDPDIEMNRTFQQYLGSSQTSLNPTSGTIGERGSASNKRRGPYKQFLGSPQTISEGGSASSELRGPYQQFGDSSQTSLNPSTIGERGSAANERRVSYRQFDDSSQTSLNPSTIGERGSATSERTFV